MASATFLFLFFLIHARSAVTDSSFSLQNYIVHVRRPENILNYDSTNNLLKYYLSFLPKTTTTTKYSSSPRLLYSYHEAINGFAARLTENDLKYISTKPGFLRAYPSPNYTLMTTHTPKFLGLSINSGLWSQSNQGQGIIIGMLDTGIASSHPSFSDHKMPSIPPTWKSPCQLPPSSPCNKKLIGARSFAGGKYATDLIGHGSHTASTAAANFVHNANLLHQANGTASGLAPRAHLAIYKVCKFGGCTAHDITAGFDSAIQDGVHVASLSLGAETPSFYADVIAISAFRAVQKGIIVVCAAGNEGPTPLTLSNEAPWIITVGASTSDRTFKSVVTLGDGREFIGQALFQPQNFSSSKQFPLIAPNSCYDNNISPQTLKGKIVLCELTADVEAVKSAGAVAVILQSFATAGATILVRIQPIPSSHVSFKDGKKIKQYARSKINPTAKIKFLGTVISSSPDPAPMMAFFSSRGPSYLSPGILKPDIVAPGVNILAAWPKQLSPNGKNNFNIISGTSMATPHVAGIVALIKNAHPNWSPAAIKSAIMTSADLMDNRNELIRDEKYKRANYFAQGSGQINPEKAVDPGLIYNISVNDYLQYLCGLGYSDKDVTIIRGENVDCGKLGKIKEGELNYPSFVVPKNVTKMSVNRTVMNVGEVGSSYKVEVDIVKGVKVRVWPEELEFSEVGMEKTYSVTFEKQDLGEIGSGGIKEGNLKWVSMKRVVRSPIVVMF